MKPSQFLKLVQAMKRSESGATHLAVGAMLVMAILYATTMV
jgi:hypothetical protein